ncbi:hypothetical protein MRX96_016838 [Rhipicephalus microplus]
MSVPGCPCFRSGRSLITWRRSYLKVTGTMKLLGLDIVHCADQDNNQGIHHFSESRFHRDARPAVDAIKPQGSLGTYRVQLVRDKRPAVDAV